MVFGTPTTGAPSSACSRAATPSVSSPPTATTPSKRFRCSRTFSIPPSTLYGFVREVRRIVPPRGRIPEIAWPSSGRKTPSIIPRQPCRMPITSASRLIARRVTARITAFRPGQSPPPVRIPMVFGISGDLADRPADVALVIELCDGDRPLLAVPQGERAGERRARLHVDVVRTGDLRDRVAGLRLV